MLDHDRLVWFIFCDSYLITDSHQSLQVTPRYDGQPSATNRWLYSRRSRSNLPRLSRKAPIPSASPPPLPSFSLSSFDFRVNVYESLIQPFCGVLRDTCPVVGPGLHEVFRQYGHPLKSARWRHDLCECLESPWLPIVAEAVARLFNVS